MRKCDCQHSDELAQFICKQYKQVDVFLTGMAYSICRADTDTSVWADRRSHLPRNSQEHNLEVEVLYNPILLSATFATD